MSRDNYNIEKMLEELKVIYDDPIHFEILREHLIDITINSFPEKYQKRARGLQFVIDCELNKYKDPVIRMNRMIEIFWEKFHEFNNVINDPVGFTAEREKNKKNGKILDFH